MNGEGGKPNVDEEEARQAIEGIKKGIFDNTVEFIFQALNATKAQHGPDSVDRAAIGWAVTAFSNMMNANQRYVPGPETDLLIRVGIDAITDAAVEAKRRCDEKRIILLR